MPYGLVRTLQWHQNWYTYTNFQKIKKKETKIHETKAYQKTISTEDSRIHLSDDEKSTKQVQS